MEMVQQFIHMYNEKFCYFKWKRKYIFLFAFYGNDHNDPFIVTNIVTLIMMSLSVANDSDPISVAIIVILFSMTIIVFTDF